MGAFAQKRLKMMHEENMRTFPIMVFIISDLFILCIIMNKVVLSLLWENKIPYSLAYVGGYDHWQFANKNKK